MSTSIDAFEMSHFANAGIDAETEENISKLKLKHHVTQFKEKNANKKVDNCYCLVSDCGIKIKFRSCQSVYK